MRRAAAALHARLAKPLRTERRRATAAAAEPPGDAARIDFSTTPRLHDALRNPAPGHLRRTLTVAVGAAAVAAAALASLALAGGARPTVRAVHNATLDRTIVVARGGRTLYRLAPETPRHLLCTGSCTRFWPPLTVRSRSTRLVKGAGIQGKLAMFRRPDGRLQVTLRGRPLYRYAGDASKGDVNGDGIQSFGGTWHMLPARTTSASATPTPAPTYVPPY